jgi:GT2 family glycosyltransferase
MDKQPYRATIAPVPDQDARPLWSVMIPTHNCARYLRETLASVLVQDLGPALMQIEVVDDCSTQDDPSAVVEELGCGRVGFYRQPRNVGHVDNFNMCLRRSRGRLVHLLHGDDCVRDGFYRTMQRAFVEQPEVGAAFCRYIGIDERGHWLVISPLEQPERGVLYGWLERIAVGQRLQPPTMVVRRDVYEDVGGFDRRIRRYGEDWEMWVRIAAGYPVWYEPEPLALYRTHMGSLSAYALRTGENVRDLRRVIAINQDHLPYAKAASISRRANQSSALAAIRRAHRMLDAGDMGGPLAQAWEALRCSHSPNVLARIALLLACWAHRRVAMITGRRSPERQSP